MPKDPYELYRVKNLNKGLNTYKDSTLLFDEEVAGVSNMDFDFPGKATQRPGYERVGDEISASLPPLGLGRLKIQSSGADYLVAKVNTTYYYLQTTATTTWTAIAGAFTASESTFDVYNDKLYVYNDTDSLQEWSGPGAFTAYALAPKGKFGKIYQNRAFIAGVSGNLSRLYYSVVGTVTDFAGGGSGFIDINKNDGYSITGIGESEGTLLIHKGIGGIYAVSFDSSAVPSVTKAAAYEGTVRHQTISKFENQSIYLATDSVRSVGQDPYYPVSQRDGEVSLNIRPNILALESTFSSTASGYYTNNKYYLSVPVNQNVYNDTVYTYAYGAWSMYQGIYAYQFIDWNGYLHFFDSRKAQMYRMNPVVKSDDGAAIFSYINTKVFHLSDEANRKQLLGINARTRVDQGSSVLVNYAPNFADYQAGMTASPTTDSFALGTPAPAFGSYLGGFGSYTLPFAGSGASATSTIFMNFRYSFKNHATYVQLQFQHSSINKSWEILSFDVVFSSGPFKDWHDINTVKVYQ